jgi:hypothetical protein
MPFAAFLWGLCRLVFGEDALAKYSATGAPF